MNEENYDIIVLGTGIKEYILLSLLMKYPKIKNKILEPEELKICQINKNKILGGESPSLNLSNLRKKFNKNEKPPEEFGEDKDWNIDLIPKIIRNNSILIKLFQITDIHLYIEWKGIERTFVYQYDKGGIFSSPKGKIYEVPTNEEEISNSELMGMFEKFYDKNFLFFLIFFIIN